MSRVNIAVASRAKRKRIIAIAKGFRGRRKNCNKLAKRAVEKAMQHAYVGRKNKKRTYRAMFISRISALAEYFGLRYSVFISKFKNNGVKLNQKSISLLASSSNTSDAFLRYVSKKIN